MKHKRSNKNTAHREWMAYHSTYSSHRWRNPSPNMRVVIGMRTRNSLGRTLSVGWGVVPEQEKLQAIPISGSVRATICLRVSHFKRSQRHRDNKWRALCLQLLQCCNFTPFSLSVIQATKCITIYPQGPFYQQTRITAKSRPVQFACGVLVIYGKTGTEIDQARGVTGEVKKYDKKEKMEVEWSDKTRLRGEREAASVE